MNVFTSIKSFLSPQILDEQQSKINGTIQVVDFMGNRRIMVGGYVQSGGFVEQLWQRSLKKVTKIKRKFKPKQAAIFGFAGGSAARVLHQLYPLIQITAVDIDPVIVKLGEKYFHTREIPHLTVHIESVFTWIAKNTTTYDLIIVDIFKGGAIPKEAASKSFINHLYRILDINGIIVVNYFPHQANLDDMRLFDARVRNRFAKVTVFSLLAENIYLLEK